MTTTEQQQAAKREEVRRLQRAYINLTFDEILSPEGGELSRRMRKAEWQLQQLGFRRLHEAKEAS